MIWYIVIILAYFVIEIKGSCGSDPNCSFCSQASGLCSLCQDGYFLGQTNLCTPLQTCAYFQSRGSDSTCKEKCQDNEFEVFNYNTLENECKTLFECPSYIPFDTSQIVYDIQKGVYQEKGRTFQIAIQRFKYSVKLIDLVSGLVLQSLQTSINNDDLITAFMYEQSSSGAIGIVAWSSKLKGIVLTSSQSSVYKNEGFSLSLNFGDSILQCQFIWVNGEVLKIRFLTLDALNNLHLIDFDLSSEISSLIASFSPSSYQLVGLDKIQLNNITTITGLAQETVSNLLISFSLLLDPQNTIQYHRLCELNSLSYSPLFDQQQNEILYYSPTNMIGSSLTQCFNPQMSISFTNANKAILDESNGNLYVIEDTLINIFEYSVSIGLSSLTISPILSLSNESSLITSCFPFIVSALQTNLICINSAQTNIYLLKRTKGVFTSELVYSHSEAIQLLHVDSFNQKIVIQSQQKLIFAPKLESLQIFKTSIGCLNEIQDEPFSTLAEWTGKITVINNSVANSKSITGRRLIFSLSDEQESRIDMISYLPGFSQIILQKKAGSTYVFGFNPWISRLTYPSLKLRSLDCSLNNNVQVHLSVREVIFESLKFKQSIHSTIITIDSKDLVIFKDIQLLNINIKATVPFIFKNCQNVLLSSLIIQSVKFIDQTSGLLNIFLSDQIQINSLQFNGSTSNNLALISLSSTNVVNIVSPIFNSHTFVQTNGVNQKPYATLITISGAAQVNIQKAKIQSNVNTLSINTYQHFTNDKQDPSVRIISSVIVSDMLIESNTAVGHSYVQFQAQMFLASQIMCNNNFGSTSNGSVYIEKAASYIQKSIFSQNTALQGGGIYFNQTSSVKINTSKFIQNKAIATGGAILFNQAKGELSQTEIFGNWAMIGGGVRIVSGWINNVIWDTQSVISGNIAQLYGANVVSRLTRREYFVNGKNMTELNALELRHANKEIALYEPLFSIRNGLIINEIRSGEPIQLLVRLYDSENVRLVYNPQDVPNFPVPIQDEIRQLVSGIISITMGVVGEFQLRTYSVEQMGFISDHLIIYGSPKQTLPIFLFENYIEFDQSSYRLWRNRQLKYKYFNSGINSLMFGDENQKEEQQQLFKMFEDDQYDETLGETFENQLQPKFNFTHSSNESGFDNILQKRSLLDFFEIVTVMQSPYLQLSGLLFSFRPCINGEILNRINNNTGTIQCLPCPLSSYTFGNTEIQCHKCPDTAFLCQNSTIVLKDGYWREHLLSDTIYKCDPSMDTCQEQTQIQNRSQCKYGSIGPLCQGCDLKGQVWGERFTQASNKNCEKCDTLQNQILYLILMFILTSLYLFHNINNTVETNSLSAVGEYVRRMGFLSVLNSCNRKQSASYMKVLTHYLQIMAVINTVQIQLPKVLGFLPKVSGNPSTSFTLSSSCLINRIDSFEYMRASVIQVSVLPLIYGFSVILVYTVLCLANIIKSFEKQFISTAGIFMIIFFQPDCVMFLLSAIGCNHLANNDYLIADANYQCYSTNNYYPFLNYFTKPALVVWIVGPLLILFLLWRRRNKLNLISTKKQFGYLYLDFKPQCYYFEFIRSLCKILIVTIFTAFSLDSSLKFDIIALVIFTYIVFSNRVQPFQKGRLAMVDAITHFILFIEVLLQILVANFSSSYSNIFQLILTVELNISNPLNYISESLRLSVFGLNIFYLFGMILLIIIMKVKEKDELFIKILTFFKNNLKNKIPLFREINIMSQGQRTTILLKWKLVRDNLHRIIHLSSNFNYKKIITHLSLKIDTYHSQNKQTKIEEEELIKEDQILLQQKDFQESEKNILENQISSYNQLSNNCLSEQDTPQGLKEYSQKKNILRIAGLETIPQEEQEELDELKSPKNNVCNFRQITIAIQNK